MALSKHPVEPAHPMVVELHDTLIAIYKLIREKYQARIDAAFDEVSRQVGFVVTTTVPVEIEVGNDGKVKGVTAAADNLKGTLFEKIASVVGTDAIPGKVAAGKYRIYLLWYPALKLRLKTDFMEPAHFTGVLEPAHPSTGGGIFASLQSDLASRFVGRVPSFGEPVHWFDPGFAIASEEAVLINAIDEVYPELRLAERVSVARQIGRGIGPGVREPAHFGPGVREPAHLGPGVREPAHLGPGVREPAHFQQLADALGSDKGQQFASELAALLRRFGF